MNQELRTVRALAIIGVVLLSMGIAPWLCSGVAFICVPAFFLTAGYFFRVEGMADAGLWIARRLRRLYAPFLFVGFILLLCHKCFLQDASFTWGVLLERIWNLLFNLSGYDEFLSPQFCFVPMLLFADFGFLILQSIARHVCPKQTPLQRSLALAGLAFLLSLLAATNGYCLLSLPGDASCYFFALSLYALGQSAFLSSARITAHLNRTPASRWMLMLTGFGIAIGFGFIPICQSFTLTPRPLQLLSFALPATFGAAVLYILSASLTQMWQRYVPSLQRAVSFIGAHTFSIFALYIALFRFMAWMLASRFEVAAHPASSAAPADAFQFCPRPEHEGAFWFLLYFVVALFVPLALAYVRQRWLPDERLRQLYVRFSPYVSVCFALLFHYLGVALYLLYCLLVRLFKGLLSGCAFIGRFSRAMVKASSPVKTDDSEDEAEDYDTDDEGAEEDDEDDEEEADEDASDDEEEDEE